MGTFGLLIPMRRPQWPFFAKNKTKLHKMLRNLTAANNTIITELGPMLPCGAPPAPVRGIH